MHGRVKVRSSEEEKARKQKERLEKLKIFQHAMSKIQSMREQGKLDKELLEITGQVLVNNPDIYTLWNIRREIFNILLKDQTLENLTKLFDDELNLTEYCLKVNPKSYCAWHHREWVLLTRTDPDWKKELSVCNKYLTLDERNFHTWDHRRFVVAQYKPPLKSEFDFTTEKLYDNFSNYSAWHYRSKMLVELYPDLQSGRPIEDSHHRRELELVQSAAFTDPDDTSAWFYQRWLLGAVKETTQMVVCVITPSKITVAFNKFISKEAVNLNTQILLNNIPVEGTFAPVSEYLYDKLFIFLTDSEIKEDLEITVKFMLDSNEEQVINCRRQGASIYVGKSQANFKKQYSEAVVTELKKQLVSCNQLLELEPDNRWTLLTTTIFQHCIDPKLYHEEVISNMTRLKSLDKLRAGYYQDLKTKWCMENQIAEDSSGQSRKLEIKFSDKIASLHHLQYYSHCDVVDLSNQNLSNRNLPTLSALQHCKSLSLESNMITSLRGFPDLSLSELNIRGNTISEEEIKEFQGKVSYDVIYS